MPDGQHSQPVELVNLTGHPIRLYHADGQGETVLAPGPGLALVAEPVTDARVVSVGGNPIRQLNLLRSDDVIGLPPPTPGRLHLVPRLTALAARHRSDLVFPHDQHRDHNGTVTGAQALGSFTPDPGATISHGPPRLTFWRRKLANWTDVPAITRRTGIWFTFATALLGAALGTIPAAFAADPCDPGFWPLILAGTLIFLAGGAALRRGYELWKHREQVLTERGSAYVIDEIAASWTHEEDANKVLNRKELPDVVLVRKVSGFIPEQSHRYLILHSLI